LLLLAAVLFANRDGGGTPSISVDEQKIDYGYVKFGETRSMLGRLFITGKMSEETYNQLRREWQEKLRHLELTLAELEREVSFHLDDLDAAMALMAKVADLYPRLEKKKQGILLQILAKQIIVDPHGKIVEHELNSPFVYLRSLVQNLSTPQSGEGSLEHVRSGVLFTNHL
jgi:hypothetical protein